MRVVVVTCWYPSQVNPGAGLFVERDVRALAHDHDVRVVHLVAPHLDDDLRHARTGNAPVLRLPMNPWNPADIARIAARLPRLTAQADVVHSMAFPSAQPLRLLPALAAPWVHTEHLSAIVPLASTRNSLRGRVARAVLAGPDRVTAVSTYLADAVAQLGRPDVAVIPNIVTTPGYRPPRDADGSLRLVAVGSVTEVKDPELALRTVGELLRRGHDVRFDWVGGGYLLDRMAARAAELGLGSRVSFGGAVDRMRAVAAIGEADVLLHTSRIETFSIVAAEALSIGRPIVIQAEGGHRDFAAPPWAALVPTRTPEAFADAVERVLADTEPLDARAMADGVAARFSEGAFRTRWNALYEGVAR